MRWHIRHASLILLVVLGCGGPGAHDPYANLHSCYSDLRDNGKTQQDALLSCLLDHPIGGALLDFSTVTECSAYVSMNISGPDAPTADVVAEECQAYIDMHM